MLKVAHGSSFKGKMVLCAMGLLFIYLQALESSHYHIVLESKVTTMVRNQHGDAFRTSANELYICKDHLLYIVYILLSERGGKYRKSRFLLLSIMKKLTMLQA